MNPADPGTDAPRPSRALSAATLPLTLLIQAAASASAIAPAVAAPALLARNGAGPTAVGLYVAAVYGAAMFSSQFGAVLGKRWGPIRTSQVALLLGAVGVMLVAVPHLGVALVGALLIGAGYGPITPASSEILARTTPPERYAIVFSIKQTGVPVGGVVAGLMVPGITDAAGPVWAMAAIAALCVLGAVLGQSLRGPLDRLRDATAPLPSLARIMTPIRFVVGHRSLFTLAMCSLVFSAVQVCVTSYTVTFLTHDLRWTLVAAGAALAVAQVAGVTGRVLWGWLADRHADARRVLIVLALAMMASGLLMAALDASTGQATVMVLLAVYGATAVGWNGVYLATIARVVPVERTAAATSGSLFFTYFGVVLGPPAFGAVGERVADFGLAYALLALPLAWSVWALWRWQAGPPRSSGPAGTG